MQLDLFNETVIKEETPLRMKQCKGCGEFFPETEEYFYLANRYQTDAKHYHGRCKPCHVKAVGIRTELHKKYGHTFKGVCECCGKKQEDFKEKFTLDHCHTTGAFRGWLCGSCNKGIGNLGDNKEGLLQAIAYLEKVENGQP
jgi:hypothetical protein